VVVGALYYSNGQSSEGKAYLYLGSATGLATSPVWTVESNQAGAWFANCVATAGDVNGDGYADVIVGADDYDHPQSGEGKAFVYLGSAAGLSTTPSWTVESDLIGGAFLGHSVATAGDVNGDGYADVIIGAPRFDNGAVDKGRAYLCLGSPSGLATGSGWSCRGQ
jgi:hypothetical protein